MASGDTLKLLEEYGTLEDCGYRWSGFRGAHRLMLESQYNYNRLCAKVHPVPYQGFLAWDESPTWGDDWFESTAPRPLLATAFSSLLDKGEVKDPSGTRAKFHKACDAWDACDLRDGDAPHYEAAYRSSVFALQPCGHSAVRKGIVDALLAGAIPVLAKAHPKTSSYVSAKDQRDIWPWNWPAQGATSIILDQRQLDDMADILSNVDDDQIALMRRAIAKIADGVAYPLNLHGRGYAALRDSNRKPNALELILHNLNIAVRESETNTTKRRCAKHARRAFRGLGGDDGETAYALYEQQQSLVDAFATSLAAAHKGSVVRWVDWFR